MTTTRVPDMACLSCGTVNTAATGIEDGSTPDPGSVCVCFYCGHIMAYDKDMRLRALTPEEEIEVAGDPRILAVQRARAKLLKGKS